MLLLEDLNCDYFGDMNPKAIIEELTGVVRVEILDRLTTDPVYNYWLLMGFLYRMDDIDDMNERYPHVFRPPVAKFHINGFDITLGEYTGLIYVKRRDKMDEPKQIAFCYCPMCEDSNVELYEPGFCHCGGYYFDDEDFQRGLETVEA